MPLGITPPALTTTLLDAPHPLDFNEERAALGNLFRGVCENKDSLGALKRI